MNQRFLFSCIALTTALAAAGCAQTERQDPGKIYYVHPSQGDDTHSGLTEERAWKTFAPVHGLRFKPGDRLEILAPGSFKETLRITGAGTAEAPIQVRFAPGRYDFYPDDALRRPYQISNTNSDPDTPKAIGILVDGARQVEISGPGARLLYRGRMIEVCIDSSEDITVSDLAFDYHRPTVSEFRPVHIEEDHVEIEVHPDSTYTLSGGKITWTGEGWSHQGGLGQELNPETDEVRRLRDPLKDLSFEEVAPRLLRGRGNHTLKPGHIYQIRDPFRDCAGTFTRRSKNIVWKNVQFHFLHGMGLVSQLSENLTYDTVTLAPDPQSGRTCAAWADGLHVSGCRGTILVKNCLFSGLQDDPVNVHGTHLQVVEQLSPKNVKVRFMHEQTFGFMAFNPGDEITFVHRDSLETFGPNVVEAAERLNPKEMLLTLAEDITGDVDDRVAVENVTWTPEVYISGCTVRRTPTRVFLITTRRRAVVEDNDFHRTRMSAILVENDAQGWYESGPVLDLLIRGNRFHQCGEPVIHIHPRNSAPNSAVHRNIRIESNHFALRGAVAVKARSTTGLTVAHNHFYAENPQAVSETNSVLIDACADVRIEHNRSHPLETWSTPHHPRSPIRL